MVYFDRKLFFFFGSACGMGTAKPSHITLLKVKPNASFGFGPDQPA
jgi:hypothetical protein